MDPATLLTNAVSAAREAAVTFSGKLAKLKVSADLIVKVVMFSMRVVVGATVVTPSVPFTGAGAGAGAAVVGTVVVVTSGSHVGYGVAKTPAYGVL
jgi:hypothetical protein